MKEEHDIRYQVKCNACNLEATMTTSLPVMVGDPLDKCQCGDVLLIVGANKEVKYNAN